MHKFNETLLKPREVVNSMHLSPLFKPGKFDVFLEVWGSSII